MSGGEASHYRGRSSLYKPAKAGCSGHSLPTVTGLPRADTHTSLWWAQAVAEKTLGTVRLGTPLWLSTRYFFTEPVHPETLILPTWKR